MCRREASTFAQLGNHGSFLPWPSLGDYNYECPQASPLTKPKSRDKLPLPSRLSNSPFYPNRPFYRHVTSGQVTRTLELSQALSTCKTTGCIPFRRHEHVHSLQDLRQRLRERILSANVSTFQITICHEHLTAYSLRLSRQDYMENYKQRSRDSVT